MTVIKELPSLPTDLSQQQNRDIMQLLAISPFDGRYQELGQEFAPWFSEFGLIRARVLVETKYLTALSDAKVIRPLETEEEKLLEDLVDCFGLSSAQRVKELEKTTHHDVQAAVNFLKETLAGTPLFRFLGEIHAATLDAWKRTSRGLKKIAPNPDKIHEALWVTWSILAEPVQLLLRQAGVENAYEVIREKTQGKHFTESEWREMIESLISEQQLQDEELITQLKTLTPDNYLGEAVKLTEMRIGMIQRRN